MILTNIENYNDISNFLYKDSSPITKILINSYQEYIFNIKSSRSKKNIDKIMKLYIEDNEFYKYVTNNIKIEEIYLPFDKVIKKFSDTYKKYEIEKYKNIRNTRWL